MVVSFCCSARIAIRNTAGTQREHVFLYTALITHYNNAMVGRYWLPYLSVQSALDTLRVPTMDVVAHLSTYYSCQGPEYETELVRESKRVQPRFESVSFICVMHLPEAVQHASTELNTISNSMRTKSRYFLLLEQDWILRPSVFFNSFLEFHRFMQATRTEYLVFQRGDRPTTRPSSKASQLLQKPKIFRYDTYSNNPYICTSEFLHRLLDESKICTEPRCKLSTYPDTYPDPIKFFEDTLDKFSKKWLLNKKIAMLGDCGDYTAYHADAKFMIESEKTQYGLVYNHSHLQYELFRRESINGYSLVRSIDKGCTQLPHECYFYGARLHFVDNLMNYHIQRAQPCSSVVELVASYVLHTYQNLSFLDNFLVPQVLGHSDLRQHCSA